MTRVLFLSPTGNIGGAERVLLTAVAGIRRELPNSVVGVLTLGDGPLVAASEALGAESVVVPIPDSLRQLGDSQIRDRGWVGKLGLAWRTLPACFAGVKLARDVHSAIRRFAPDLVHSNGIKTHLLTRFVVPRRIPLIWHVHDFFGLRPMAAGLLRRASARVRVAIAISNAVAIDVAKAIPGLNVVTILNAIDLTRFSPAPGRGEELDFKAAMPAPLPSAVRVGLVATYARWKGHLIFLDAAAKLATQVPTFPIRWYIVGGPIYHTAAQFTLDELRAAAAERGVADRVGFVGFTSDTPAIYRALDVVVHASTLPEPFGLTIVEAMSCGRAVVVSAAGGASELFFNGEDAIGFAPGDAAELAGAVQRLAQDVELRNRLGFAARRTAEAKFDADHYCRELVRLYDSISTS